MEDGPLGSREGRSELMGRTAHFALGTAQLGMPYGIANALGVPDERHARTVLDAAAQARIGYLDTSPAYGVAERVIGRYLADHPEAPFHVVTKLPSMQERAPFTEALEISIDTAIRTSLATLGLDRLPVLLLHDERDYTGEGARIVDTLQRFVENGVVGQIGVSVYTPAIAEAAASDERITAIQAPANALDMRFRTALTRVARRGGLAFGRSVYLQGLLLLEPDRVPAGIDGARRMVDGFRELADASGLTPRELALRHALASSGADWLVIGCESAEQVLENARAFALPPLSHDVQAGLERLRARVSGATIDPSAWVTR